MKSLKELAKPLQREEVLQGISIAYRRRLIRRALQMPKHNRFWSEIIAPNIMVPELNQHVALHRTPDDTFSHKQSEAAHYARIAGTLDQGRYPLFSNVMRIPQFGPAYPRYTDQWSRTWEKPSARGTIGQFWTFTFEWDCEDAGAMQTQFDWVWDQNANGLSEIDKLDQHFRSQFKDYRGHCEVWSGGKSVHVNFIFDTSHMSRATLVALAARQGKSYTAKLRDYWRGDISPDAIWDYYTATWTRLNDAIHQHSSIDVDFDPAMATLFQKRRTPWGIRIAQAEDKRGFVEGDQIPQVVLHESILKTSSKSASGMFLCTGDANAMPRQRKRNIKQPKDVDVVSSPELLEKLTDYLAKAWGAEYPKPAEIFHDANGMGVRFYNSPTDVKPSSMAYGDYCSMRYLGKGTPAGQAIKYFPGQQTLNDMISDLSAELARASDQSNMPSAVRPQRPWMNAFAGTASEMTIDGIRTGMSRGVSLLSQTSSLCVVVSAEGAGKSTSLIRQAGEFRMEDQIENFFEGRGLNKPQHGHQIVACKSYPQAEEQYLAYNRWYTGAMSTGSTLKPPAPLLIRSFSEIYKRHCAEVDIEPIGYVDALRMGFESQVEAVMHHQPSAFSAISDIKNEAWFVKNGEGNILNGFTDVTDVLVFTVHDLAHGYNNVSKSKAWLNPTFTPAALADHDTWVGLATEFKAYRIIHDELSLKDLVHLAHDDEVRLANQFKATACVSCIDTWTNIKQSQRLKEFQTHACKAMWDIGFHRINEVADLNFGPDDIIRVDYDAIPFGVANKPDALYRAAHERVVYVRNQNWWTKLKARVVFTTTETLPAGVARNIFAQSSPRRGRVVRWDSDVFFSPDPIQLRLDTRANKKNIDALVTDILADPDQNTDLVISDMASGSQVMSHSRARGCNDLTDQDLATILTFIGEVEYMELNVIGQKYGIENVIQASYLDRYNQAAGRNRGLRGNALKPLHHDVYVTPRLLRDLGGIATFQQSRYPAFLAAS
jgi:hypothetical protein